MQLVSLAHNLCDDGRAPEAEDLARSLLGQSPNLPSAQVVLARAWGEQGRLAEARALLEQVVTRNPAFFAAHRWLAEVLVAMGDYPRASDVLLRAEAISPGQPRVGELIQLVMGAPRGAQPGAPETSSTRAPPPPPARRRRQTWEGPAVTEPSPQLETLVPPAASAAAPPRPAAGRPTATRPIEAPAQQRAYGAAGQAWNYAPPAPMTAAKTALPKDPRFPGLITRVLSWTRRHPSAVLTVAGVTLFTLAALTVVITSWALRPRSGSAPESSTPGELPPLNRAPGASDDDGPAPLGSAGFDELLAVLIQDRRLRAPRPTPAANRALLASALLASEYGRPGDRPTEVWADELVASLGNDPPPEELAGARVLLRVARGDRAGAEAAARALALESGQSPLLRFVEARRLSRNGEGAAAIQRLGPDAESSPFPLGRLLLGELSLDRGDPDRALAMARSVLGQSPRHPLAVQLLMEAHQARGGRVPAEEAEVIGQACKEGETRVPTLAAACRLDRALALRRAGSRQAALTQALAAAEVVPAEPRLLSLASQALANLGAVREARLLAGRAEELADRALPPLAWARIGVELATNRRVRLPEAAPPGPEARLVAARTAFVGLPDSPALRQLLESIRKSIDGDRDLQLITRGARARNAEAALNATLRLRERFGLVPPGPVAAYVAGTLARRSGLRPLARVWLSRALTGHGDACRATTLFRLSLRDVGDNPLLNPRLQRAIGRLGCDRLQVK
jgi:tetratricopeptide (TPR) repeat protein